MYDDVSSSLDSVATDNGHADPPKKDIIQLFNNILRAQLGNNPSLQRLGTPAEWVDIIFKKSNVFYGCDELMWGAFIACIYRDPQDSQLSCILIDKVGVSHFSPIDVTGESQYYPAIENLVPAHKNSESRQCIAVTFLQRFAQLSDKDVRRVHPDTFKFDYDPTHAGDLASACIQMEGENKLVNIGRKLLSLGFFQDRLVSSTLLDVVYEYNEAVSEPNNKLVFYLGKQLEQLFNPLTEYSPEQTEHTYKAPSDETPTEEDDALVKAISRELLELQTNFTLNLVEFLQKFVIVLRIRVLNGEIEGLSTVKLNRLFPPTIDEVTRINCIFLDSLKSATPFGSLEVLKACSVTIPYFYKAYTRHEAATKNFNKDIKLFLKSFYNQIPLSDVFTEMKIDSLIKGPQEKLMKIKLIIDRLYASKKWDPKNEGEAKKCYDNVIEIIDSFGRLEGPLNSYNSRVFTPSGKILTELAKGWPAELQYKWLKRRVVGVFDMIDPKDPTNEKLLVIFSDYLMFLDVVEDRTNYGSAQFKKPSISDILMNSLVNEVPLPPKMPQLRVDGHCYIDEVFVTLFGNNCIRFDAFRDKNPFAVTLKVQRKPFSAYTVADLVTKAKILEKDTAFHLFKATHDDITVYSTAHEMEAYSNETIKSKFALFLNMNPTEKVIMQHKLHVAMFAKFVPGVLDTELVQLDILTSDGGFRSIRTAIEELIPSVLRQLSFEIPVCFSSIYSPLLPGILAANESIIKGLECFDSANAVTSRPVSKTRGEKEPRPMSSSVTKGPESHSRHRPAKSYATITTFRSNISDTKTAGNRQSEDRFDFEEMDQPQKAQVESHEPQEKKDRMKLFPQAPAPSLAARQESQPASKKAGRHQKRRSISNIFKSIFSKKKENDSSISTIKDKTKKKSNEGRPNESQKHYFTSNNKSRSDNGSQRKRSSVLQNNYPKPVNDARNSLNGRSPNESLAPVEPPNTRNKAVEEKRHQSIQLGQFDTDNTVGTNDKRFSTVSDFAGPARNTSTTNNRDSALYRKSQISEMMNEEIGQPERSDSRELKELPKEPPIDASKDGKENHGSPPQPSVNEVREHNQTMASQANNLSDSKLAGVQENIVAEDLEGKPSRESQVFNDDLFGDVIPDPKKGPSTINETGTMQSNKRNSAVQNNSQAVNGSSVPGPFDNKKVENFDAEIKPQENVQQNENEPEATHIEATQPTDNFQDNFSQKKSVNPRIQNLKASKIDFEKSSSFVELFQGMRLVLDESDAKYNWKSLPSEYSLRDTSPVNFVEEPTPQPQHQHAFKSIAFAGINIPPKPRAESAVRRPPQAKPESINSFSPGARQSKLVSGTNQNVAQESGKKVFNASQQNRESGINQNATQGQKAGFINQRIPRERSIPEIRYGGMNRQSRTGVNSNAFVSPGNPTLSADGTGNTLEEEQEENQRDVANKLFENTLRKDSDLAPPPKLSQQSSPERPARKKIPTFKVINNSPTRIIQRISPDRAASPYNIPSDISISSDLDEHTNKRLFELKFSSKDDINDSGSSPVESAAKPSMPDATTQDVGNASETSAPSVHNNDDSNTTPEDSLPEGKPLQGEDGGLLDDLDFSSFNVTFDTFNRDRDVSQRSITRGPSVIIKDQEPLSTTVENPRSEEPLIYRLPKSNENSTRKSYLNRPSNTRQVHNDDDPIWISPSKLDYYDINKFTGPAFKDAKEMIRTATNENMHKIIAENPTSMNELSYAYLASIIDDDDDQPLNSNDRPIRLTFKE
ncbi:ZYRO0E04884p [Zygosaccharomyces rouxii]|uniref:ZYRO0E04884p n=2 Tax=Zygosaccharomyces rouxii TaxID=4956 RepID=C5E4C8_ZYGRC|nr:uncharacterized protein ZYRO0E04884g [Zygosaccharomyces rouxii]KAH9198253.1 Bud site selection protein 3 [Zygosaccharomyces rouxii]CAQ43430.1 Bud site selection protein 3 [Zygosaccharomyces rouxii]CAR30889.1 ZYRO0E04884p [Zygosaccharomyces rouxii]